MNDDLINYEEATNALEKLRLEDILRDGEETPFTFDSKRANDILSRLERYGGLIKPILCIECRHRIDVTKYNSDKKESFIFSGCRKIGKYLGDYGYCSYGERKEREE